MESSTLDKNHKIEQEFHDQWARTIDIKNVCVKGSFEAVTALENRIIMGHFGQLKNKKLLDLGCGAGEASVYFALQGAQVTSVDISEEMLKKTRELAAAHGVTVSTRQMVVEKLDFAENTFDYIYGSSILHHADTESAIRQAARVLKPDGTAAFIEPLNYNIFIKIYRKIAKEVMTPAEHPLKLKDFQLFKNYFESMALEFCWFSTLSVFLYMYFIERIDSSKDRYWKRIVREEKRYEKMFKRLHKFDQAFLRLFPFMNRFCWTAVAIVKNKKPAPAQ